VDTTAPVITVTSGTDTVEQGSSWTDAGATTNEGSISFTGTVNTDVVGTYTITYSATDPSNNTATATRTVTVVNQNPLGYTTTDGEVAITDCDTAATGELVIPDTIDGNPVTSIGEGAFEDCTSLTSITIGNSVTSIGAGAFNGCTSLTSITIPDSVTSIGASAFGGCTSLTSVTIGNSVTSIGEGAFADCTSLTSITIGNSVTSIGDYAFLNCASLTEIIFQGAAPTALGNGVFTGVAAGANALVVNESLSSFGKDDIWNGLAIVTIFPPVITVTSGTDTLELGSSWTDAGATADGGETVTASGTVDTNTAGTYTITYTATDAAGNAGSATRTVTVVETAAPVIETQTLNLKAGWNLVSFYVDADDMTPATIFAPIQNKLLQVKNLTQSYDPSVPSFLNTLSSLSVKDGYWLKVSEDASLDVEGPVPSGASINVKSGWNLVGYLRLSGEAVADELTSLGNTVVQIKDLGSSYDPSVPSFLNTLSTMAPGSGYWLNVDADGTWNVGTVVEVSELNFAAVRTRSNHSSEERAGPSWGEAIVYPNIGATVLAKVTIQGKPVAKGGVVAAFVGNELRGLQDVVLNDGMSYVTLNVNLNGEESVSYRVWNPNDRNEYLVSGTMLLDLGSIYGKPELMELDAVTVVDKAFQVFNVTSEPFGFSFNTTVGRSYTVEAAGDLRRWKAVELFQGSGGEIRFTAKPTSSGKSQFFRVLVE